MSAIRTEKLTYRIDDLKICKDISVELEEKKFTGVIGPNGSGKSTFLKQLYGVIKPTSGRIYINDKPSEALRVRDRAKLIGVMAQENGVEFPFTVYEVAAMGRSVFHSVFDREDAEDKRITEKWLDRVGLLDKSGQLFTTLSGGEKQRVMLARALIQETEILILDEPTNHLDIGYQWRIMEFLKSLDKTIISAVHDLNFAARFCDYLVLLNEGEVISSGTPREVLTDVVMRDIFKVRAVTENGEGGFYIRYLSSADVEGEL